MDRRQTVLIVGFTAVFIGYLTVWLPGPGAGLSFLGVEMGEWLKFLGLGPRRDLFYLPPIILGLTLALWTTTWPAGGWRAWAVRGLAVLVALLAFPAVEDIMGPVREQYVLRAMLVALTTVTALLSGFWRAAGRLPWALMAVLALAGAVLPTWQYLAVRPYISDVIGAPLGIGLGVWLNLLGQILVAGGCVWEIAAAERARPATRVHEA